MTSTPNEAQDIQNYTGIDTVMVGNGNALLISATAWVLLPHTSKSLDNIFVVSTIKKNLLSVSQFIRDNNCYFIFYPWGFLVKELKTKDSS